MRKKVPLEVKMGQKKTDANSIGLATLALVISLGIGGGVSGGINH